MKAQWDVDRTEMGMLGRKSFHCLIFWCLNASLSHFSRLRPGAGNNKAVKYGLCATTL